MNGLGYNVIMFGLLPGGEVAGVADGEEDFCPLTRQGGSSPKGRAIFLT